MYERSYGYLYNELGHSPATREIADAIRADIKTAKAEGLLPAAWKYSVRSDNFSGGCSIDVAVKDCADAWEPCDGIGCHNVWCKAKNDPTYAHAATDHLRLTEEARVAKMTLERIHGAYNHDGSEIMVDYHDVRYYGIVTFDDPSMDAFRKADAERVAAKRKAREEATVVGRVAKWNRDGSVVHVLVERADGVKVLSCGARISRTALIQRVGDDHAVTCSRCSKRAEA